YPLIFNILLFFFCSSRRRHTRFSRDWSSDVCASDLAARPVRKCADGLILLHQVEICCIGNHRNGYSRFNCRNSRCLAGGTRDYMGRSSIARALPPPGEPDHPPLRQQTKLHRTIGPQVPNLKDEGATPKVTRDQPRNAHSWRTG